jgi:IclR helix-turn-helix domain
MQALHQGGTQTLRTLAQALGMSKSSVHRHQQALQRRQQHPESGLWESPAGAQWLKLLVLATVFVFCCQRGVGCETVSAYFKLLRLDRHIGLSVSSVRQLKTQIETHILTYQQQQQQQYRERQVAPLDICAAVDETFFEQVVLVLMDLASGFIVLETITADSRYETWQPHASQALAQLGLQVRYCVSDRAKALITYIPQVGKSSGSK